MFFDFLFFSFSDRANLRIAFQAHSITNYQNPGVGNPLKFGTLVVNDGGCYSRYTGIFTTKIPGLYFFIVTTTSGNNNAQVFFDIVVDGVEKASGFSFKLGGESSYATAHLVHYLNVGNRVWVKQSSRSQGGYYDSQLSHFSGMLISL